MNVGDFDQTRVPCEGRDGQRCRVKGRARYNVHDPAVNRTIRACSACMSVLSSRRSAAAKREANGMTTNSADAGAA